ncbi:uncharacterized protein LOC125946175 isoform X2 [Dermacentor silvarum]|uniref:uncharacterized protein LOC125946175 isoform X1 n=1 Tax=Dermacentor silvarum TaxID=543639 RepID=UPI0021019928|nr:uncharacterized protein LOC125946175 isoform X1 [Dermacentor silvarum]XP_049524633.1 uncharacterized protein LOC125946175 isoform X2 [Dermacentor silvarum]
MPRGRPSSSRTSPPVTEPSPRTVIRVPLHSRRQTAPLAGRSILARHAGAVGSAIRFSTVKAAVHRFLKDPAGQPLPKPVLNCLSTRFKEMLGAYAMRVAKEARFLQQLRDLEERLATADRFLRSLEERLAEAKSRWFSRWRAGEAVRRPGC